ncbi:MAG: AAA-like domain-containing protein, partial [Spirulinaceae cyanobacterium]
MNIDDVLVLVEQALLNRGLSPIERLVLQQSWLGYSYNEIAENSSYVSGYIKEVGSQLWQEISDRVGDRVTKKNLQLVLRDYCDRCNSVDTENSPKSFSTVLELPEPSEILFPGTPLTTCSSFYIPRPAIEVPILKTLQQSGCAIRIKGSQNMGKTSLLNCILDRATALNYRTVAIDLQEAEKSIFVSLDRYLRWFCAQVSRKLDLEPRQEEYWNLDLGSKVSCRIYFEAYLLQEIKTPIVLALDEVHRLFDYPEIAQEFLPMLRSWHEQAQRLETWQKLRLIIAYTSESSSPLKFNQSPFNVGIIVKLPPLTLDQMQDLAHCYSLPNLTGEEGLKRLAPLAAMVGGHPYLVHIAFYHLCRGQMSLIDLLNQAPTPSGIYSDHLRYYLALLQSEPSLI